MATPQLDFDPWEDGTPAPAGHGAPAAGKTQAIDFDPWADGPARTAANDSTPAKVPGSEDKPGFLRTGWEALKRGGASAIASTAHTVADTIDQVVQAPVRQVMGALGQATKADPAAVRAFEDPLGARAVADENLGVAREIDADRQAVAERIGPRPGMADWRAHPGDAARSTALRLTNAAGESLPLLAAAVATRSPTVGAALMGGASGAQEYTDLRVDGIDRANAAQAGALTGAVEAAGEAVGLPAILGKTGRGSLARAALAEGAQEAPVQIAQTNIDDEARGQVTPVGEQLLGAVDAALVGGALGGAAHLAGGHRGGVDGQVSPAPEGNGDVPRGNALPPEALALPPPDRTGDHGVIHVGPDGAAVPATQAVQARHPGFPLEQMEPAAPNSQPFPGATPGSLADALNATTETAATSALVSDPGGASAAPVGSLADAASALPRSPATQEQRLAQIAMDANDARGRRQKERELDAIARESRLPAALQSADQADAVRRASGADAFEAAPTAMELALRRARGEAASGSVPPAITGESGPVNSSIAPAVQVGMETDAYRGATSESPTAAASQEPGLQQPANVETLEGLDFDPFAETAPASPMAAAAAEAATSPKNDHREPTDAQKEAGNYRKGHTKIGGLDISIENEAGTSRRPEWPPLKHHYGYIKGSVGADKDHVDVFLTEHAEDTSRPVFVVDQYDKGKFDEAKVVMGVQTADEARAAYLANYSPDFQQQKGGQVVRGAGAITQMTQEEFKAWVKDPAKTAFPAGHNPAGLDFDPHQDIPGTAAGMRRDHAERLVRRFTKSMRGAPEIVLVDSAEELHRLAGVQADGGGARAEGLYNGKPAVFLNTAAIDNPKRFRQVLAHEVVGHFGVEQVVGDAWPHIAQTVARHVEKGTGARWMREAIAKAQTSQPGVTDPQALAREVVAVMAEQGSKNGLLSTVIARTRATLRKAIPSVAWTDRDVRDVLTQAEGFLRQRPATAPAVEEHPLQQDDAVAYGDTRPLLASPERGATAVAEPGAPGGRGAGADAVPAGLDVFLATGPDSRPVAASQTRLLQSAKVVRIGEFRSGIQQVKTLADAAHVLAPLRKSAQEKFLALALDANGAPVAVLQHTVGTVTGSQVTPGTVLGAVAAVPGIRSVVFAHNHPSASQHPSPADMALDATLNRLFQGSGIEVKGSIILQPGRGTFTAYTDNGETADSRGRITPARRTGEVPVVERQLRKVLPEAARRTIANPTDAAEVVQALRASNPAGVVLLNSQRDVVGHLPFDPIAVETLRTGDPATSQAKYVQAAVEGNAYSAVLYGDALFARGIDNLAAALRAADIRPLDMFTFDGDKAESWASGGRAIGERVFYSKPGEAPADVAGVAPRFDHVTDPQRAALGKIATHRPREPLADHAERLTRNLRARLVQGTVDQFHAFRDLDETAYMQARLSKGTDGAVEGVFRYGPPKLTDGALDIQGDGKGFLGHLQDLQGEHDLFLAWVAGHRSEQLATEGREHLFTPDDIGALKRLNKGHMPDGRSREAVYRNALVQLNRYQSAILDIAQEAGIVNDASRKLWNADFYVPFFRDMAGQPAPAPHPTRGGDEPGDIATMRKAVIEKLVGGGQPLNDLLENTLQNWGRLLASSMRNMAATRALNVAVDIGAAKPMPAAERGTVSALFHGERRHFMVEDPLVLESLVMLYAPPWSNPAMKTLQWFKRALTIGVTTDPSFRIRNLIRDSLSVVASNGIGANPLRNIVQGWKATERGSDTYLKLLGGGGAIRFGVLLDGDQARHAKRLIEAGLAKEGDILSTPAKAKAGLVRLWDAYQEIGDRAETMNRAALYEQAIAAGKSHLEASYAARDTMDFTNTGAWPAVQFLTRVVPFMNARLQGLYKLGRGAKQYPRRFAAVAGAVAMASVLLHLLNQDDGDYRALPDWVRDTYWWIRVPGTSHALYIPKPFELGALGSIAERGTELALAGDDYQLADFAGTLRSILSDQLSMNPIPQAVRPAMEASFNWNSFQGRPIDSMGQERLPAEDRYTARTSAGAVALGRLTGSSPQKIEHLARGYFGWLGLQALNASDLMARDMLALGANPAHDFGKVDNLAVIGSFIKARDAGSSKYVQRFYDQQREVDMLYAAYAAARQAGDLERARELAGDDRLKLRGLYLAADREMTKVNRRIRQVTNDKRLSAEAKANCWAAWRRCATRWRSGRRSGRARSRQGWSVPSDLADLLPNRPDASPALEAGRRAQPQLRGVRLGRGWGLSGLHRQRAAAGLRHDPDR